MADVNLNSKFIYFNNQSCRLAVEAMVGEVATTGAVVTIGVRTVAVAVVATRAVAAEAAGTRPTTMTQDTIAAVTTDILRAATEWMIPTKNRIEWNLLVIQIGTMVDLDLQNARG
ncbi:jg11507 [Pararge aegeria aegeria]|uniref:Jg11507 protein n=1 Tax=Pararge aegeria aegeria TaxID=348720 RepID=A0A8S4RQ21_9NEOP|nr:jg11507 [Pararge aegeria aegeria]